DHRGQLEAGRPRLRPDLPGRAHRHPGHRRLGERRDGRRVRGRRAHRDPGLTVHGGRLACQAAVRRRVVSVSAGMVAVMPRAEHELDLDDLNVLREPAEDLVTEDDVSEEDLPEEVDITEVFDGDNPVTGAIDEDAPAHYRDRDRTLTDRDREMLAFERQWWRH